MIPNLMFDYLSTVGISKETIFYEDDGGTYIRYLPYHTSS